jgi:hypothetical protein
LVCTRYELSATTNGSSRRAPQVVTNRRRADAEQNRREDIEDGLPAVSSLDIAQNID